MITDADIKKMKAVFATKKNLKNLELKFASKEELKTLDIKVDRGFAEIIEYIGETRDDIVNLLSKQINDFREEMRDIIRTHQSTLNNHETRIAHLEYTKS